MKKRRFTAGMLAVVMLAGSLAGCTPATPSETKAPEGQTEAGQTTETLEGSLVSAQPQEFSVFLNVNNTPFDSEWSVFKEAAKRTNISLKGTISLSNSNEEEAFNLMLSSGQLADIIGYVKPAELEKLGRDGGLIPLNDLIKEHAPNIQKELDKDSRYKQAAYALDGNIYQVPQNKELVAAEFWWIRQDWMDKLGLETPTTVEQLHDVLLKFRNEDPNGNGVKDEIPLFDRAGWKQPDEYLYLWDSSLEFYPRDGKMTYEPMTDNFKVGVKNMIQWYKEGIIDPEIFTRGASSRDTLLSGDLGGLTHDWVSTGNYNESLAADIPGFNMIAIPPVSDQNGLVKERVSRYPSVGWGISSLCKDPVAAIKYMDYFFTEEGRDLINWGIEGETYTVDAKGDKTFNETVLGNENPLAYLRSLGVQYRIGMSQDGAYEYAMMTADGIKANELYNGNTEWYDFTLPPYEDGILGLKYTSEDETEYKNIMGSVTPYVKEKFQSWILGVSDFEADYDSFIKELELRGIDRALEINQEAYETYMNSK